MILLDTHVVIWLYEGRRERLSEQATRLLEEHDVAVSPVVRLELAYLSEIGRIRASHEEILSDLSRRIGLMEADLPLSQLVAGAIPLTWTRDPFDRLLVAQTRAMGVRLVTADRRILENCREAVW